jgi:hypothetical protein
MVHTSALALVRLESPLEGVLAGLPYNMIDTTLVNGVAAFPVIDARSFWHMIQGMHMDLIIPDTPHYTISTSTATLSPTLPMA